MLCLECGEIVPIDRACDSCCGNKMVKLKCNDVEAAKEKHVPVVNINNDEVTIRVGEVNHPMEDKHYIKWIYLVTNKEIKKVSLEPNMEPLAKFNLDKNEEVLEALDYCNLHGLWINQLVMVK